ncbi:CHASE2 domain-containing protein [Floridanema aerugineum]|jgi:diguanylate cyclase (GGDEF)-like protein|uniref:CHASE2 domain-containing protein n=1 Tax=Floridaenema aerugineum BLCC-F46 TaxID=3153654 RepID=A0ABV4X4X0_9CYAN
MWLKLKKRIAKRGGLLITAPSIAGLVIAANSLGVFQLLEWATFDQFFAIRPPAPVDPRIVVITIDESDINKAGQWPISDAVLAKLITKVKAQKPEAIGLDIYRDLPVPPGHLTLVKLFQSTPNLIGVEKVVGNAVPASPTLSKLKQVGMADLVLDADGKVRRALLSVRSGGEVHLSLGTKLALMYLEKKGVKLQLIDKNKKYLQLGEAVVVPFTGNEGPYAGANAGGYQIILNYRGSTDSFNTVSMTEVLNNQISPDKFRDRLVLIGNIGTSFNDLFFTPYSSSLFTSPQRMPGVLVHANITSQIISAAWGEAPFFRVSSPQIEALWVLFWSLIGGGTTRRLLRVSKQKKPAILPQWLINVSSIVLWGTILIIGSYLAFLSGWILPVISPIAALILSAISSMISRYLELQHLVNLDGLTGVANRRCFDEFLHQKWGLMAEKMNFISLILCDVDYFKKYNDTYGHQAGDESLRQVAKAIAKVIRSTDLVARYGGEEFAVIMPNTNPEVALKVAKRITANVKSLQIVHENSLISDRVTLSCGVASMVPNLTNSISELINIADQALYEAKRQGRDRIIVAIIMQEKKTLT